MWGLRLDTIDVGAAVAEISANARKRPTLEAAAASAAAEEEKASRPAAAPAKKQEKDPKKQKKRARDSAAGSLPNDLPFTADAADHAETPLAAYEDVVPILHGLAMALKRTPSELKIWDPFYCTGAAKRRLDALGFPAVHHRCEDFHALVASGSTPEHDILVTNPPYSADHLPRLFEHCVRSGKPWALLLPWFVVKKPWFRAYADSRQLHYLVPRKRYHFLPPPSMVAEGRERVTSPFETFWYLSLGDEAVQRQVVAEWQPGHGGGDEAAEGSDGEGERCRLGVGFKKRRGTPGFHTLLDEDGLLFGRPVPEGWDGSAPAPAPAVPVVKQTGARKPKPSRKS